MPANGWDTYSIALISAGVALLIPVGLRLVSKWFSRGAPRSNLSPAGELETPGAPYVLGERINSRFLLAANLCLGLIALMLMLIPCVGAIQPGGDSQMVVRAVVAIVTIASFTAVGLFYFGRKGDLDWVRSFERKPRKAP